MSYLTLSGKVEKGILISDKHESTNQKMVRTTKSQTSPHEKKRNGNGNNNLQYEKGD